MSMFDKSTVGKRIHPTLLPIFKFVSTKDLNEEYRISGIGKRTLEEVKKGNANIQEDHLESLRRLHKIGTAKAKPAFTALYQGLEFSGVQIEKLIK